MAHLAGADGPELLARDMWEVDGRSYKGRLEFGAAAISATSLVFTPKVSTMATTEKATG